MTEDSIFQPPTPDEAYEHGFQSGIITALELARDTGYHDFMRDLVRQVDRAADSAGLPRISIPPHLKGRPS